MGDLSLSWCTSICSIDVHLHHYSPTNSEYYTSRAHVHNIVQKSFKLREQINIWCEAYCCRTFCLHYHSDVIMKSSKWNTMKICSPLLPILLITYQSWGFSTKLSKINLLFKSLYYAIMLLCFDYPLMSYNELTFRLTTLRSIS